MTYRALNPLSITRAELAEMLDKTGWSKVFSWNQIETLSEYLEAYEAPKDFELVAEGTKDPSMCILIKGQISIRKGKDKNQKELAIIRAPQSFGEMSLIDGEPRSASAISTTEVVFLVLTKKRFFELSDQAPALAVKLLWGITRMLSKRLRKTSGDLLEFFAQEN